MHATGTVTVFGKMLSPKHPTVNVQVQKQLTVNRPDTSMPRMRVSPPRTNVGPPAFGRAGCGPRLQVFLPPPCFPFLHLIPPGHSDIFATLLYLTSIFFFFAVMWKENRFQNLKNCWLSSDQFQLGCQSALLATVGRSKKHTKPWTIYSRVAIQLSKDC